ncbi:MAG: type II toxin-antitoxin system prevent-host-death family antitoxin [Candidatus Pacebacteria bacterium]|nr:type II toxin-antitoxin system prevent-host-death family antitoxin [Candidatus Paceibacterota bacterium]
MVKIIESNLIGFKELRENSEKYIEAVARGKSFTIVRRSKPIFKITPVSSINEENWEPFVDFKDKNGSGIKTTDLLKMLNKFK